MLIALPNPDFSFTATLFAPYEGPDGFDNIDATNPQAVDGYFNRHFPDVVHLMPEVSVDFKLNPVGSLVTVRVSPWNMGRVVLIGDAAHAVVPFYGQGMNAAFEDGLLLFQEIQLAMKIDCNVDLEECAKEFAVKRKPAADSLADLCVEHYNDMASNTESFTYLVTKKVEGVLTVLFPSLFKPLYTMVAFTNTPYNEAVSISSRQNRFIISVITATTVSAFVIGATVFARNVFTTQRTSVGT
jgi:kynurenine 3-monooxygenase